MGVYETFWHGTTQQPRHRAGWAASVDPLSASVLAGHVPIRSAPLVHFEPDLILPQQYTEGCSDTQQTRINVCMDRALPVQKPTIKLGIAGMWFLPYTAYLAQAGLFSLERIR